MSNKLRQLLNQLISKQEKKVDELIKNDCDIGKEGEKLSFLKECERELDYLEDLASFHGG